MRQLILLAFIGVLLMKNATPKNQGYPSLEWLFGLNSKSNKEESKEETKPIVCQSKECKKFARIISENIDKSVDPCDDFYEHACGKWQEHNPNPGVKSWNMFYSREISVTKQIIEMLDKNNKHDHLVMKTAKKWYAACINTDAIKRRGLEPLISTLFRAGGWPMIMEPNEWNEQEYSWQKVDDQYMRLTGRNAFHSIYVYPISVNDSSYNIVYIDTPQFPLGWYKLLSKDSDRETKDDEDSSDEQNSQEPGSEGESEDDDKSDKSSNDDNKDSNNDDNDDEDNDDNEDDDNDDNTNEKDDDKNVKKKINTKNINKLAKNKQIKHSKTMRSSHSKKYENHTIKKDKIKRRTMSTNSREKLRSWKNERNHVKHVRWEKLKKTLKTTTSQNSKEETTDKNNKKKQYADYISKVARALAKASDVKISEERMNKDIQDMIDFQIKLTEINKHFRNTQNMTLNEFQEWYDKNKLKTPNSAINWVHKIWELFDEANVPVSDDLHLSLNAPHYFKNLTILVDKTSSRTIVNYVHWNFLNRIIQTTTSEMRKLYNVWNENEEEYDEKILGVSMRSFACAGEIKTSNILAYEYVEKNFPDKTLTTILDMMDDIQKEIEYDIKESDWLDENTTDFFLAKLVYMKKFIGYPDWYKNDTIVKQYFRGLVVGNSYYENMLSYDKYTKWRELRSLMEEDDYSATRMGSPLVINAFFSPWDNTVEVPAAYIQTPWFAYDRPIAINYGIIGLSVGHEINHGFDDTGHLFDKNGEYMEWLSTMAEEYDKRAECFVEQFNNYLIDKGITETEGYGNLTAGENIADTMGLDAAFKAYRRRERECRKTETILPGHEDLTNDQLFFLSFAYLFCEPADTFRNKMDPHSPGRLRIIGSVSNSQDFAEAYNCPVGSAMNPEKKCNIWK